MEFEMHLLLKLCVKICKSHKKHLPPKVIVQREERPSISVRHFDHLFNVNVTQDVRADVRRVVGHQLEKNLEDGVSYILKVTSLIVQFHGENEVQIIEGKVVC